MHRASVVSEVLRWGATTFDCEIRAIDKKCKVLEQAEVFYRLRSTRPSGMIMKKDSRQPLDTARKPAGTDCRSARILQI